MSPDFIPQLHPAGPLLDLWRGLTLPVRAMRVIASSPSLLGWSALCALITAGALVGVGLGSWSLASSLAHDAVSSGSWWKTAAGVTLEVSAFVVLFTLGALTVPNLALAPTVDFISEATEARCGDFTPPPFSVPRFFAGIAASLTHTLVRLVMMGLGYLVLLPLNLIPGAGNAAWLFASTGWAAFWLTVEHLSNPMARHLTPFRQVLRLATGRLALSLGLGFSLWLLLWVPVLNCLVMPVAVVAGTLLYRGLGNAAAGPRVGLP